MWQYQISIFHLLYFDWELQLRGNFWQGPFFKDALFENGTKSHNFTNLYFCDVTLKDSIVVCSKLWPDGPLGSYADLLCLSITCGL